MGLVLTSAAKTVGVGVVVGLALSVASNRLLAQWTAGSVFDPAMLGTVIAMLLAASGLAAFLPARRAASCDPIRILRAE